MGWGTAQTTSLGVYVPLGIQQGFREEVSKPGILGHTAWPRPGGRTQQVCAGECEGHVRFNSQDGETRTRAMDLRLPPGLQNVHILVFVPPADSSQAPVYALCLLCPRGKVLLFLPSLFPARRYLRSSGGVAGGARSSESRHFWKTCVVQQD